MVAGIVMVVAVFLPWSDDFAGRRSGWQIYEEQSERALDNSVFSVSHYRDCFCTVYTGLTFLVIGGVLVMGGAILVVAALRQRMRRVARALAAALTIVGLVAILFALTNRSTLTNYAESPQYGMWMILAASVFGVCGAATSWWAFRVVGGPSFLDSPPS